METTNHNDTRTDHELIDAINHGDVEAFETLYFRYRDWVVNLAWRFTEDPTLALDVLQETFLYFHKKFPGFKLTAQLKTFLYPAVRNLSIGARRKSRRYQSTEAEQIRIESTPHPESPRSDEESLRLVLHGLSDEHREVLLLRFVEGLDLNEISTATDIPLGTVKSRLHNALRILRQNPNTRRLFEE